MPGVCIICGLKREASILAGANRISVCGDASALKRRLAELAGSRPQLVISWGLCAGLDPRLRPGNLVIGDEVSFREERIRTNEGVASALKRRLSEAGEQVSAVRFAAAEAPVLTANEKAQLRHATGAAAVDMESLIAGRFARELEAPFAILRAVADPAERNLPPLAAKAIDSEGRIDAGAIVAGLLRSPGQATLLGRVARDSAAAFSSLKRCRDLLPSVFLGIGLTDL
jgi:nucleoside phosphorylase